MKKKCILPIMIRVVFGKMHFLLISQKDFSHEIKCDGITSFHGIHDWHLYMPWQHKTQPTNKYYRALWHHSIVGHFINKQTNKQQNLLRPKAPRRFAVVLKYAITALPLSNKCTHKLSVSLQMVDKYVFISPTQLVY